MVMPVIGGTVEGAVVTIGARVVMGAPGTVEGEVMRSIVPKSLVLSGGMGFALLQPAVHADSDANPTARTTTARHLIVRRVSLTRSPPEPWIVNRTTYVCA